MTLLLMELGPFLYPSNEPFIELVRTLFEFVCAGLRLWIAPVFLDPDTPEMILLFMFWILSLSYPVFIKELCIEPLVSFMNPCLDVWLIDGLIKEALLG